ncbi:MAG: hypothetical protein QOF12_2871, partial [Solirubrobacteraceae bacterium]|nr:hypothetical protein [Solirubrobacteraceae bacterium]
NGTNNCGGSSPCSWSSARAVQRVFTATPTASGNLDKLTLTDATGDAYSEALCTSNCADHTFHVSVHFADLLQPVAAGSSATPTLLRNQGNTVSCDGDQSSAGLVDDFSSDPNTRPVTNPPPVCAGQWFRAATDSDPCTVAVVGTQQAPTWCVGVRNGNGTNGNNIGDAVSQRLEGGTTGCPYPNQWSSPGGPQNGDPRLVTLFTIFRWPGSNNVPVRITGFGEFYITAWAVQSGARDQCNDVLPPTANAGDIYGYFVNGDVQQATPSDQDCDFSLVLPCISTLVD